MATTAAYQIKFIMNFYVTLIVALDKETVTGLSVAVVAAVGTLSGFIIILILAATFCLYQWKCSESYYVFCNVCCYSAFIMTFSELLMTRQGPSQLEWTK